MSTPQPLQLTLEDGRKALGVHVLEKGYKLRAKYGKFIDYENLLKILKDEEFVRYPTKIIFDSQKIEKGMFAVAEKIACESSDGYVIYVHEVFQKRLGDVIPIVLYHLVTVNYGDFATFNEAEEFGSAVLGMEKNDYYRLLCRLADSIDGDR